MSKPQELVYYSDGIAPVLRDSPDQLFFMLIEARPTTDSKEFGKARGAFVSCFVDAADLWMAERIAVEIIQDYDWRPHRFEEWKLVTKDDFPDWDTPNEAGVIMRDIFEQAFDEEGEGGYCVFNVWPIDAPDWNGE